MPALRFSPVRRRPTQSLTPPPRRRRLAACVAVAALAASGLAALAGAAPASAASTAGLNLVGWGTRTGIGTSLGSATKISATVLSLDGNEPNVTTAAVGPGSSLLLTPAGVYTVGTATTFPGLGGAAANDPTLLNKANGSSLDTAGAKAIAKGGDNSSLLVDSNGNVWAWGANNSDEAGVGHTTTGAAQPQASPVQVPGVSDATFVAGGGADSYAIESDGSLWAWGAVSGLGNANFTVDPNKAAMTPTSVPVFAPAGSNAVLTDGATALPPGVAVQQVVGNSTNDNDALALLSDGSVWAWGDNTFGEVGNGTTTAVTSPVPVIVTSDNDLAGTPGVTTLPAGEAVTSLGAGDAASFAVLSDGSFLAWGEGSSGQLGLGNGGVDETTPTAPNPNGLAGFPTYPKFTQIVGYGGGALGVTTTGLVYAWGFLGTNALLNTGGTAVAASFAFPYAGAKGTSTQTVTEIPQQVAGLQGVPWLAVGPGNSTSSGDEIAFVKQALLVSPATVVAFFTQPIGTTSASKTVELLADDGATATVTKISIVGPDQYDFSVANLANITLPNTLDGSAGGNQFLSLVVRFTPTHLGEEDASIVVNSQESAAVTIPLQGDGVPLPTNAGPAGPAGPAGKDAPDVVVSLAKTSVAYHAADSAKISVATADGAVAGKVQASYDGKAFATATLSGGRVTVALPKTAKPGEHVLAVRYLGNTKVKAGLASRIVTVTKAKPTLTLTASKSVKVKKGKATIRVVVRAANGVPVSGKVRITVAGKTTAVTLKKGKASVKLAKQAKLGKKTVKVAYLGSAFLLGASKTIVVKVVK